jgi:hypothetical protein
LNLAYLTKMSYKKAYLAHFLAMLILGASYFMGSSLAAPAFQRRDEGDGLFPSSNLTHLDTTSTMTPVITPTPVQGSPDVTTTTFTTVTSTLSAVSSSITPTITPTPTGTDTSIELVPPVTVVSQLGTTAVVVASQGTTTTISIPKSGASGIPSPTGSSYQAKPASTSDGVVLTVSSSMIAAGLAIAAMIMF